MKNTRMAFVEFDTTKPEREAAWKNVATDADVLACETADKAALDKVRVAFYEDTKDINNLAHCMIVSLLDLRVMAKINKNNPTSKEFL